MAQVLIADASPVTLAAIAPRQKRLASAYHLSQELLVVLLRLAKPRPPRGLSFHARYQQECGDKVLPSQRNGMPHNDAPQWLMIALWRGYPKWTCPKTRDRLCPKVSYHEALVSAKNSGVGTDVASKALESAQRLDNPADIS